MSSPEVEAVLPQVRFALGFIPFEARSYFTAIFDWRRWERIPASGSICNRRMNSRKPNGRRSLIFAIQHCRIDGRGAIG
jgi:hypothetical protein